MSSPSVFVFFLCGCFFVSCASDDFIGDLKRKINETNKNITLVEERNVKLTQDIKNAIAKFNKSVVELQDESKNVSEAVRAETKEIKELYGNLTLLRISEKGLKQIVKDLEHWVEGRRLAIFFLNQDLRLYKGRIDNGSAEKCLHFVPHSVLSLAVQLNREEHSAEANSSGEYDEILFLEYNLMLAQTELKEVMSKNQELTLELKSLTASYELEIQNLKDLIESYKKNEETGKKTIEIFKAELKELQGTVLGLKKKIDALTIEKQELVAELDAIKQFLSKWKKYIDCFIGLEKEVLGIVPFMNQ